MKKVLTAPLVAVLMLFGACGGTDNAGDIEKWLVDVGNDSPESAKCVAEEMKEYSVSDFEKSMRGEASESFENKLDDVYDTCDASLGISETE